MCPRPATWCGSLAPRCRGWPRQADAPPALSGAGGLVSGKRPARGSGLAFHALCTLPHRQPLHGAFEFSGFAFPAGTDSPAQSQSIRAGISSIKERAERSAMAVPSSPCLKQFHNSGVATNASPSLLQTGCYHAAHCPGSVLDLHDASTRCRPPYAIKPERQCRPG